VQHLKLPHYVDFQSELELVRRMRTQIQASQAMPDMQENT
jgi:alpha-D-ribose 1-methylphosphonate 5-triphosphate synthase subunit PhnI